MSIGADMFPAEGLYFRQDITQQNKIKTCDHKQCFQPTKDKMNYCEIHLRMHQDDCIATFNKLNAQIGHKWDEFIAEIKQKANPDDQSLITVNDFIKVYHKFGAKLRPKELTDLKKSFPGSLGSKQECINLATMFDQKYSTILQNCYNKVDISNKMSKDEPDDTMGYLGKSVWYRDKMPPLKRITDHEFIRIIVTQDKMQQVMMTIRQIDKDNNGYVTRNELDDILKLYMKESLNHFDLTQILNRFSSIQNQILIDYMKFQRWVQTQAKDYFDGLKKKTENALGEKLEKRGYHYGNIIGRAPGPQSKS